MRPHVGAGTSFVLSLLLLSVRAIDLDVGNADSIKSAAKTLSGEIIQDYYANSTNSPIGVGIFGSPYYWWEAGAVWDSLVGYWFLTGDGQYNNLVSQALLAQIGPNNNYMPPNQTKTEGNDDQSTWGLAALSAAEYSFPSPLSNELQWIDLAKAVIDAQVPRWDTSTCAGGLRWQIFTFNSGYNYKNSLSAANFFLLAARLAQFTGNQTYADLAVEQYNWMESVGLISETFQVFDGTDVTANCTRLNRLQWTNNAGAFLYGSAVMYNLTNASDQWRDRVTGFLNATSIFFANASIIYEPACEPNGRCDVDQQAFKGLFARQLGRTVVSAPFTAGNILPLLKSSAEAAARSCSGGPKGVSCGQKWYTSEGYDGVTGLGETLSAFEVIQANLVLYGQSLAASNATHSPSVTSTPLASGTNTTPSATSGKSGAGCMKSEWSFLALMAALSVFVQSL